jgi:phosphatidate cytidylyltransferase
LFSAAVLITSMVLLLWFDFSLGQPDSLGRSGILLAILCIIISTAAADEFARLWRSTNCHPNWLMMTGAATMIAMSYVPLLWRDYPADCPIGKFGWVLSGIGAAVLLMFVYEMLTFSPSEQEGHDENERAVVATRIAKSSLAFIYIAMLLGFVLPHRQIDGNNNLGITAVVLLIATVKLSDSFAYFVGKSIGSKKIAPKLSPNKTVEGAIAALVGGVVGAAIVVFWASPYIMNVDVPKPMWWFVVYGLAVTLAGMVGDLAESLLKRDAQIKDSSSWLPGLGGVLDVIDSMVFAAPVSFVIWLIG